MKSIEQSEHVQKEKNLQSPDHRYRKLSIFQPPHPPPTPVCSPFVTFPFLSSIHHLSHFYHWSVKGWGRTGGSSTARGFLFGENAFFGGKMAPVRCWIVWRSKWSPNEGTGGALSSWDIDCGIILVSTVIILRGRCSRRVVTLSTIRVQ